LWNQDSFVTNYRLDDRGSNPDRECLSSPRPDRLIHPASCLTRT